MKKALEMADAVTSSLLRGLLTVMTTFNAPEARPPHRGAGSRPSPRSRR